MRRKIIVKILDELFPHPKPCLLHKDPYTLLIAVLLSAQCTDSRVNAITPKLFAKADTPEAMADMSLHEIETLIHSCGFYRNKAKAIKSLSEILVKKYKGRVPRTLSALEALPGVGHKTASVMMTQAFHKPAFPVDTHIHRLAKRWGLSQGKTVAQTESDLKKAFPQKSWNKLHLQFIYYARAYCPARGHKLDQCPICTALNAT